MSGIPTNIITIQMPPGSDPAGGDGGYDFGPMLDVMKGVQLNVGSINQNVKAILEVLKRMSSMRGGPSSAARGGSVAASVSPKAGSRARFAADLLEYRKMIRGGESLGGVMRQSHAELLARYKANRESLSARELRAATRLRSVEIFGESVAAQNAATEAAAKARQEAKAQREAIRAQRESARAARAQQSADLRASRSRMTNSMAQRVADLRRQAGMPGATVSSIGLTDEERAVLAGEASPSGLPGTRAHFRAVGGIVDQLGAGEGAPAPAPGRFSSMAGGVMRIVTMVGRVLSVAGMVTSLLGKIWGAVRSFSQAAMASRAYFSRIDPVFATLEAQFQIGQLLADMRVASSPSVRSAATQFTATQLARQRAEVPIRKAWEVTKFSVGTLYEQAMFGGSLLLGGAISGDARSALLGLASLSTINLHAFGLGSINQYVQSLILRLAGGNNTASANALFIGDLVDMTGGRFSTTSPYMGPKANASNWWGARP
jgi:hypothetical protein